jgi:hypothetical protein
VDFFKISRQGGETGGVGAKNNPATVKTLIAIVEELRGLCFIFVEMRLIYTDAASRATFNAYRNLACKPRSSDAPARATKFCPGWTEAMTSLGYIKKDPTGRAWLVDSAACARHLDSTVPTVEWMLRIRAGLAPIQRNEFMDRERAHPPLDFLPPPHLHQTLFCHRRNWRFFLKK